MAGSSPWARSDWTAVTVLDGGWSFLQRRFLSHRLLGAIGRARARVWSDVQVPSSTLIHPQARVQSRSGTIRFGEDCVVAPHAIVQGDVTFGDRCSVQPFSILVGYPSCGGGDAGRIEIGDDVRIASHAMIIAANHVVDDPARPISQQGLVSAPIVIEDDVWIAGRVTITAGVRVGRGAVLAAGAVVTKDVPRATVVAGVPARVIRRRDR